MSNLKDGFSDNAQNRKSLPWEETWFETPAQSNEIRFCQASWGLIGNWGQQKKKKTWRQIQFKFNLRLASLQIFIVAYWLAEIWKSGLDTSSWYLRKISFRINTPINSYTAVDVDSFESTYSSSKTAWAFFIMWILDCYKAFYGDSTAWQRLDPSRQITASAD